ncbi:tetratricopeptide repeat protein [Mongoliitalea daihaiensis]|uniref:tetratricopeptide repeat protein n=1 Tax=Mongoliitalea daihaiensis TaxID=2782006 RepID=UPI001F26DC61|nr:tetratricopeptide repeat protein [Mongoliitalea daihaiensis]UJP65645.1 tetratricopeptide repeat protein [Mongoliitalea daihaiensis]
MISRFLLLAILLIACQPESKKVNMQLDHVSIPDVKIFQGMSFLGDSLVTQVDSTSQKSQLEKLQLAEQAYEDEQSLGNLIWIGRREAYLGRYDLAIKTFSKAIKDFPEAYEPLRHRGHRYISIRKLDEAIVDFEKAARLMEGIPIQLEEDGLPNALNIPLSSVQFNVWYHLGLAHYLKADYEKALLAYEQCMQVSDNDDLIVATLDWYYMTLVKLNRLEDANQAISIVHSDMNIIENDAYYKRIQMYQGKLSPSDLMSRDTAADDQGLQYVTQGYGLGNYYLALGDTLMAKSIFQQVLDTGYWSAFGYIASEMELTKLE